MKKFINSPYIKQIREITHEAYLRYWDERNGGNISYLILPEEAAAYEDVKSNPISSPLGFDASALAGSYFLVTGTGRYFRNVDTRPTLDLGLVKITEDGQHYQVAWGFEDGGKPTSEFASHLMSHIERLKVNPKHRVVLHCHPTNLIALSFTQSLSERDLSRLLWKMQAESIIVLPDGIGLIPYMTPGTNEIGEATAAKMAEFSAVLWPFHGVFAAGSTLDETYGIVEVLEKAAMIYSHICMQGGKIKQSLTDRQIQDIADAFSLKPHPGFLDL